MKKFLRDSWGEPGKNFSTGGNGNHSESMNQARRIRQKRISESGAALLIAIFALMLISVVAIALVVSQGTDSALAGNYRTSIGAYYAGVAGLEEARGRLSWRSANCLGTRMPSSSTVPVNTAYCLNPQPITMGWGGTPTVPPQPNQPWLPYMTLMNVRYILNPASGETVDPTGTAPANYPDTEYGAEMGWPLTSALVSTTPSVWSTLGTEGPAYKWVRINPITEHGLNMDVDGKNGIDSTTPLYFDPSKTDSSNNPTPGLFVPDSLYPPPADPAVQALEITSLAVLPNGGHRLLQYVVVPETVSPLISAPYSLTFPPPGVNLNYPAALTLLGYNSRFTSSNYHITGQDESPSCSPPSSPAFMVPAIGYTNASSGSQANVTTGASPATNYTGFLNPIGGSRATAPVPGSFNDVTYSIRQTWQTPASLDAVVQEISKNADYVFQGNTNASAFNSLNMTATTQPLTIVVNGNLNMTAWPHVGNGLLLVTGTLTFDANMTWEGVILVIGRGKVDFVSNGFGGGIDGAMLIAETRNAANTLLPGPNLGAASFRETGGSGAYGRGLNYNSCNVNSSGAQAAMTYKILSFREIQSN